MSAWSAKEVVEELFCGVEAGFIGEGDLVAWMAARGEGRPATSTRA